MLRRTEQVANMCITMTLHCHAIKTTRWPQIPGKDISLSPSAERVGRTSVECFQ